MQNERFFFGQLHWHPEATAAHASWRPPIYSELREEEEFFGLLYYLKKTLIKTPPRHATTTTTTTTATTATTATTTTTTILLRLLIYVARKVRSEFPGLPPGRKINPCGGFTVKRIEMLGVSSSRRASKHNCCRGNERANPIFARSTNAQTRFS